MSIKEFRLWMEFDAFEPIGGRRHDFLAAMIMAQQANLHRAKDSPPKNFSDFMFLDRLRERIADGKAPAKLEGVSVETEAFLRAAAAQKTKPRAKPKS